MVKGGVLDKGTLKKLKTAPQGGVIYLLDCLHGLEIVKDWLVMRRIFNDRKGKRERKWVLRTKQKTN